MRMLLKVSIPVETGNRAAEEGVLGSTLERILKDLKPEAAYFAAEEGQRTAYIVLDMKHSSDLPGIAEPFFLAFNARVSVSPVMNVQDLAAAESGIKAAVKGYSRAASA
jgi:hypothetical protein